MKKEVFFAILAGVTIGLLVAFGSWNLARTVKQNKKEPDVKITPSPKNVSLIAIDKYQNYDVITESPIIKGVTQPNSDVVINTENNDYLTKADNEGEFEAEIEIPIGISEIIFKSFSENGTEALNKLILVYSENFSKYQENEKDKKPVSYSGSVTDISKDTIQIKTDMGQISQITIEDDTSYINTLKKNAVIKITDLALGDYIVAMGFLNGNKVLRAKQILVSTPVSKNIFDSQKIKIETLTKNSINDIVMPKKWNGPNLKELKEGQNIYIVGSKDETQKYTLRSLFKVTE